MAFLLYFTGYVVSSTSYAIIVVIAIERYRKICHPSSIEAPDVCFYGETRLSSLCRFCLCEWSAFSFYDRQLVRDNGRTYDFPMSDWKYG